MTSPEPDTRIAPTQKAVLVGGQRLDNSIAALSQAASPLWLPGLMATTPTVPSCCRPVIYLHPRINSARGWCTAMVTTVRASAGSGLVKTFDSLNPATSEPIATFPIFDEHEVAETVARAREAAAWWSALPAK